MQNAKCKMKELRCDYKYNQLGIVGAIHGAGVQWTPLRSRSTDRAGRRDYRPNWFYCTLRNGSFVNDPYKV